MNEKVCSKCGEMKPLSEFRYLATSDRHHSWCKCCEKKWHTARYKQKERAYDPRKYAKTAIRKYVAKFGRDVIDEALNEEQS